MAKYLNNHELFTDLVTDACLLALPRNKHNFDTEFIRI